MGGNTVDVRVFFDTTCSKGEGLAEGDGKGEGGRGKCRSLRCK